MPLKRIAHTFLGVQMRRTTAVTMAMTTGTTRMMELMSITGNQNKRHLHIININISSSSNISSILNRKRRKRRTKMICW